MVLKILGGLCLVVMLAVLGVAGWLYYHYCKLRKALGELGQFGLDAVGSPARIRMERTDDKCRDEEVPRVGSEQDSASAAPASVARPYIDQFLALGFQDRGTYLIREMPSVRMAFFHHPDLLLIGAVTMLQGYGVYADVCADFPSGAQFNVLNSTRADTANTRPGKRNISVQTDRVEDLVERAKQELAAQGEPPIDSSRSDIAAEFERQWALDMDMRLVAWVNEEEIRRTLSADGKTPTEEEVQLTVAGMTETYCRMATEACMDHFLKSGALTAAEWQRHGEAIFLVHERQSGEDMLTAFREKSELGHESLTGPENMADQNLLDAFAQWAETLNPPQYRRIGTVDSPVRAHVYAGNLQQTAGLCERLERAAGKDAGCCGP